ncbi:MAG: hypothetical protein RLZZ15_3755, partial [Verrucomicrobiota bacterium]
LPDPRLAFLFIGGGPQRAALERAAAARGLDNLRFLPAQPRARLAASLGVGDVHLVTLRPGCEHLVFPSKLAGVAAIARPVIFLGPLDCEIARLVTTHDLGLAFSRDETDALATALATLAADPARVVRHAAAAEKFAAALGDADSAAARWHALLDAGAPAAP